MVRLSNNNSSQGKQQLSNKLSCSRTTLTGLTLGQCQDCGRALSCSHINFTLTNNFNCNSN